MTKERERERELVTEAKTEAYLEVLNIFIGMFHMNTGSLDSINDKKLFMREVEKRIEKINKV